MQMWKITTTQQKYDGPNPRSIRRIESTFFMVLLQLFPEVINVVLIPGNNTIKKPETQ